LPLSIRNIPEPNPTVNLVQMDLQRFSGLAVRWGGVISKVENKASRTWVEVVSKKLEKDGEPLTESKSSGRFIASFPGFVDPVEYKIGAVVTVSGVIDGEIVRLIGEYSYTFPIVKVRSSYLWPEEKEPRYDYSRQNFGPYGPWPGFNHLYPYSHPYSRWP
jgi:outer membrane lipoprotein